MAFDFPSSPTIGQVYQGYKWDGEKWIAFGAVDLSVCVSKSGDTMSGDLVVSKSYPALVLDKTIATDANGLYGKSNGKVRWGVIPGTGDAESGSNQGTNFFINAYNDAGAYLSSPIMIGRASGLMVLQADPVAALGAATKQYADATAAVNQTNNLALNGGMEISQEFGSTNTTIPNNAWKYTVDQWQVLANQVANTGTFAFKQDVSRPVGFANSLLLYCGTAYATLTGATDLICVAQPIEGSRWARLTWGTGSAIPVTISFWINAPKSGAMSVTIKNGAGDRVYIVAVTINAAATWEYKQITIPGCTDGTWPTDNTMAANLVFAFGCGTSYSSAPNLWIANGNFYAHSGVTNFFTATNAVLYITGVSIMPGSMGPAALQAYLVMRQFPDEWRLCQRYWERIGMTLCVIPGTYDNTSWYKVSKRATPTITALSATNGGTVGAVAQSPLDGMRQVGNPSGAIDVAYSISSRM